MSAGVTIEIQGDASSAVAAADQAKGAMTDLQDTAGLSTSRLIGTTTQLSMLGVTAFMAFDMASAYGERYAMLQERVLIAQENVTKALMNYGAGSIQVVQAQQQLVAVQHEAKYAQNEYNREMLMMSAMIIPQFIGMIPRLTSMFESLAVSEHIAAVAGFEVADSELAIITAGIGAIALIGTLAAMGGFSTPGGSTTNNYTQYGDTNIQGAPFQFGTSVQSWTQAFRG